MPAHYHFSSLSPDSLLLQKSPISLDLRLGEGVFTIDCEYTSQTLPRSHLVNAMHMP
jgi:hypothetical protein